MNTNMANPEFTASYATYLIGVTFFLSALLSLVLVQRLQRKTLLVGGYSCISLSVSWFIYSIHIDNALMCLISILCSVVIAMSALNPVTWVYMPEVLNDKQFSFVCTLHYVAGILLTVTTEPLVDYF